LLYLHETFIKRCEVFLIPSSSAIANLSKLVMLADTAVIVMDIDVISLIAICTIVLGMKRVIKMGLWIFSTHTSLWLTSTKI
jgi:hypothetical protein